MAVKLVRQSSLCIRRMPFANHESAAKQVSSVKELTNSDTALDEQFVQTTALRHAHRIGSFFMP